MTRSYLPPDPRRVAADHERRIALLERRRQPTPTTPVSVVAVPMIAFNTAVVDTVGVGFSESHAQLVTVPLCGFEHLPIRDVPGLFTGAFGSGETHIGPVNVDDGNDFSVVPNFKSFPTPVQLTCEIHAANADMSEVLWARTDGEVTVADPTGQFSFPVAGDWVVQTQGSDLTFDDYGTGGVRVIVGAEGAYWFGLWVSAYWLTPG